MTTDEKHNGWTNRETWAFMLHVGSSEPLQDFARSWVGDTAKNEVETLEFIRMVKDFNGLAHWETDRFDAEGSKSSDATLMLTDMGNLANFRKVNSAEVADHLNEFFEDGG